MAKIVYKWQRKDVGIILLRFCERFYPRIDQKQRNFSVARLFHFDYF